LVTHQWSVEFASCSGGGDAPVKRVSTTSTIHSAVPELFAETLNT